MNRVVETVSERGSKVTAAKDLVKPIRTVRANAPPTAYAGLSYQASINSGID